EIGGMNCGNCARHVTEALQGVPGVRSAVVDLVASKATVRWDRPADATALVQAVAAAGYEDKPAPRNHGHQPHGHAEGALAGWQINLWVGVLVTVPLMLGEWVFDLAPVNWFRWVSFGLAAIVQVIGGAPFYKGAWKQLKVGSSNMDLLVALGSTTA